MAQCIAGKTVEASGSQEETTGGADFWLDVWRNVEAPSAICDTLPANNADIVWPFAKRRRLFYKQPALYHSLTSSNSFVHKVRRRLVGKQPPPLALATRISQPACGNQVHGHYDVLFLMRDATAGEIRMAYRRRALATHPDKGGDAQDFIRVSAAFDVLGDVAARAAYNLELERSGSADGLSARLPEPPNARPSNARAESQCRVAVRLAQVRLLASSSHSCKRQLSNHQLSTLEALFALLSQKKAARGASAKAKARVPAKPPCNVKCLRRDKSGYTVRVAWASLNVCTGYTQSLAQAVDWHIALCWLRDVAQTRLKSEVDADPLTEDEWLQALEMEPTLQGSFFFIWKKNGKLINSPAAQDLQLAMSIQRRYLPVLEMVAYEKPLENVKRWAVQESLRFRQDRRRREQALLKLVQDELISRNGILDEQPPRREPPSDRRLAKRQLAHLAHKSPGRPSPVRLHVKTTCPQLALAASPCRRRLPLGSTPTKQSLNTAST